MIGQGVQPGAPPLEARFRRREVSFRWAVAVAAVAIVALGAMLAWGAYGAATQPDGEQVVTQLTAAWGGNDAALLEEVYAEDAVLVSAGGATYEGIQAIKGVSRTMAAYDFRPEVVGPVVQSGATVVAPIRMTWSDGSVLYVTSIFELNSTGQVVHHQDYGPSE
ncbi:MAG: nuclear transport factor 2 family protein [Chloroflexota bacterium]